MSRFVLWHIALTITFVYFPALPVHAENPILSTRTLKSASEFDYPPFSIVQSDGSAGGFSVDLLKAAVEAAGLEVSFKVGPWHELKQELIDRKIDVLPLVSYSTERDKVYDFTAPYLRMNGTIFVRIDAVNIGSPADLRGKEVLVMDGDTAHEYAVRERLTDRLIPVASYEEAFQLLSSGKHDAIVVQQIVGLQIIKNLQISNVVAVQEKRVASLKPAALKLEGFEQKFCFAVPEGEQHLLSLLNEGLAVLYLNGTYTVLYEKWFTPILPKPRISLEEMIKQIVVIIIPLLLILSLLGVWYLRRLAAGKTESLQQEIEHRKTIETQLEQANRKYIKAQEIGKVGNWEYDLGTQMFWGSDEAKRIYGFDLDSESFTTEAVESCIPERKRVHQALIDLIEKNVPYALEFDILTRDTGECRTIQSLAELEKDNAGNPVKILGVIQDITERKRSEEQLKTTREELESFFQLVPDLICIASTSGYFVKLNKAWETTLGFTEKELLNEPLEHFLHADDVEPTRCEIARQINGSKTFNFVNRYRTKEGSYRWLEWNATAMVDQSFLYAVARDITVSKQAEDERKILQSQLQQAQKMEAIGTLAGGIAHDFNNILGAIIGYAEIAGEDCPAGSMVADDIKQILKAGHRAKDLVLQILAFSRQATVEKISMLPALMVGESLKMLRSSLPRTIEMRQDIDPEAGPIVAEPTQIHQIMMNLCTNAFHAMEETGGILTITLKSITMKDEQGVGAFNFQPKEYVRLSVGDTGIGIHPDIREKIFDPYFTTKGIGKGTGLGLAMVHGIVKNSGGWISCQSQLGEGTVFHVYLPVEKGAALPETMEVEEVAGGDERILLVDDEEMLADMGKVMLSRLGYHVTVKTDSMQALKLFEKQPLAFDLVITDQTMPGMPGSDLARRMLQIRPALPIILCTGYSSQITEEKAKVLGIRAFIYKPLVRKNIAALIRKVLDS